MITENEQPIWFEYIELDNDLNQYIREDAPEEVKEAYKAHLAELEKMSESGEFISK